MMDTNYRDTFIKTYFIVNDPSLNQEAIIIKVDQLHKELDRLISEYNSWAFITAWNPLPEILSIEANRKRNNDLKKALEKYGYNYFHGIGKAEDETWAEESLFIVDISKEEAIRFSKHFGQKAFLFGKINHHAELIMNEE